MILGCQANESALLCIVPPHQLVGNLPCFKFSHETKVCRTPLLTTAQLSSWHAPYLHVPTLNKWANNTSQVRFMPTSTNDIAGAYAKRNRFYYAINRCSQDHECRSRSYLAHGSTSSDLLCRLQTLRASAGLSDE
jgi:hypothetical protein